MEISSDSRFFFLAGGAKDAKTFLKFPIIAAITFDENAELQEIKKFREDIGYKFTAIARKRDKLYLASSEKIVVIKWENLKFVLKSEIKMHHKSNPTDILCLKNNTLFLTFGNKTCMEIKTHKQRGPVSINHSPLTLNSEKMRYVEKSFKKAKYDDFSVKQITIPGGTFLFKVE